MLDTSSSGAKAYGKAWHLMSELKLRPPTERDFSTPC